MRVPVCLHVWKSHSVKENYTTCSNHIYMCVVRGFDAGDGAAARGHFMVGCTVDATTTWTCVAPLLGALSRVVRQRLCVQTWVFAAAGAYIEGDILNSCCKLDRLGRKQMARLGTFKTDRVIRARNCILGRGLRLRALALALA